MPTPLFQICLFEDEIAKQLARYQFNRPVYTMPIGQANLVEKLLAYYPHIPLSLISDSDQRIGIRRRFPKVTINQLNVSLPTLYINARATGSLRQLDALIAAIVNDKNHLMLHHKTVVAMYCDRASTEKTYQLLAKNPTADDVIAHHRYISQVSEHHTMVIVSDWWDYMVYFGKWLTDDFDIFSKKSLLEGDISSFSVRVHDDNMAIADSSTVCEFVSLDATNGPIIIMDNVTIHPFVRIEGPCFIGRDTQILPHAVISESYIGNGCKMGGEVSRSMIQHYSNKAHFGYVGDTVVGEWVNLGAGTTTSNLKVSYGPVTTYAASGAVQASDRQFLGARIGDFVKTGVYTRLDCGAVVGSGSSLFGSEGHEGYVPNFTWGHAASGVRQDINAFLVGLTRMMKRRQQTISTDESLIFKRLFEQST